MIKAQYDITDDVTKCVGSGKIKFIVFLKGNM